MSEHKAIISWKRDGPGFLKGQFSREHTWTFDGGLVVPASASPSVVPAPWSNPAGIDPEEGFVASLSSCHMLTFVFLAYRQGFTVDTYRDEAVGTVAKNDDGMSWVNTVTLHPQVVFSGDKLPTPAQLDQLHHLAHDYCFIANSVKTEVIVKPVEF